MEYQKQKDFNEETHGRMISTLKELIHKRDFDKKSKRQIEKAVSNEESKEKPDSKMLPPDAVIEKGECYPKSNDLSVDSDSLEKVFMITKDFSKRAKNIGHPVE